MTVTLQFANAVRRLGRDGMNVGEIAATLGRPESDVMETLRMLGLPLPGEFGRIRYPTKSAPRSGRSFRSECKTASGRKVDPMADAPAWDIAPSIAPDRRAKLLTAQPFEGILARILAGANLDKAESEWEPARFGDIVGARRFRMFVVSDDLDALDYFFNGRSGYRGAYALSEEAGNEANRIAVAAIRPFAMRTLPAVSAPKGTNADGVFDLCGAKVWIDQRDDTRLKSALDGNRFAPEVLVGPWQAAAERKECVVVRGKTRYKANAGVLAPTVRRLAFRGAWILRGNVVPDSDKAERSLHLHRYGFA